MKRIVTTVGVLAMSVFIGSTIYWKYSAQVAFHEYVTVKVKKGIDQIDICETKCGKSVNCRKTDNLSEIESLMLFNEASMGPTKTKHTYEGMLRVYSGGVLECFRAVEYESKKGDIYLYQVFSGDNCRSFKHGAHSVFIKGLSRYIISNTEANQALQRTCR